MKNSKVKLSKPTQDELDSHVEVIEDSVAEMAHHVSRAVAHGLKGLPTCSSEKMLVNSFNCLKSLDFHIEKMKGYLNECFDSTSTSKGVNKCLIKMRNDLSTLKNKLGKGYSCGLVTNCQKGKNKIIKPKPKTDYCMSYTGNGTTQKCLKKIKDGSLFKMSKNDIDKFVGSWTDNPVS
jgi:hypothetical protein